MRPARLENFELSLNQKRLLLLNKNDLGQLYTQISVEILNQILVEDLVAVLDKIIRTHETLSSRLVFKKDEPFPQQAPAYYEHPSIEILTDDLYEAWIANQQDKVVDEDPETILPVRFFIFSDSRKNVTLLIYR